jgi:hypothetical protein
MALGLIGLGVADLVGWSPDVEPGKRSIAAIGAGAVAVAVSAALAGISTSGVFVAAAIAVAVLAVWLLMPSDKPGWPLAWILMVIIVLFAAGGSADPIGGDLKEWYSGLPVSFVAAVSVEQFVLAVGAVLFLLATANRVVRLVLEAAGTSPTKGESSLRGGRLLGPMERLIVGAIVIAGDPAGAALVIAAKSLLRFPEIRDDAGQPDSVTEYFLIGTFTSLLLAASMALLILGSA